MDTNGEEILLHEATNQTSELENNIGTVTEESLSSSYSSSEDSDDDITNPQEILNKAGCTIQLSNLQLTQDGSVPLELLMECVQCLCANSLWPALILCKAISVLKPDHELAGNLLKVIAEMIEKNMQGSNDDSESSESDSSESSSCSESDGSSSDTEDDIPNSKEQKKVGKHTCLACTNQLTN